MRRFSGVHTIMPTPFTDDGRLDLESLERLTDFLIRLGVDGLVVLGVMGEAPKLSQREQEVIRTTVRVAQPARYTSDGLRPQTVYIGASRPFGIRANADRICALTFTEMHCRMHCRPLAKVI